MNTTTFSANIVKELRTLSDDSFRDCEIVESYDNTEEAERMAKWLNTNSSIIYDAMEGTDNRCLWVYVSYAIQIENDSGLTGYIEAEDLGMDRNNLYVF